MDPSHSNLAERERERESEMLQSNLFLFYCNLISFVKLLTS